VATGVELLARIRSQLSGFARVCRTPAVASVFGLGATWIIALLTGRQPPFRPVLLTMLILVALPAADGMAALLLERLKQPLVRQGEASRRICVPSPDPEDEALAAVEKPLDQTERDAVGLAMARSAGALADVEQEASARRSRSLRCCRSPRLGRFDLCPFLPQWAPTVLGNVAEAAFTLLIGWCAWRFFETGLAVKLSREEGGSQSRARTVQPLLRAVGRLVIGAIALMSALSSLGLNIAPLLASAGVVGIAVGFGAQTLVLDLFSGDSYLVEDVFRMATISKAGTPRAPSSSSPSGR
jgi:hypothetical protein